jgi:hypothetical protein
MHLIVRIPFDGHEIGDRISDQERVKAILGGSEKHLEAHCIKIADDAHGWRPTVKADEAPARASRKE